MPLDRPIKLPIRDRLKNSGRFMGPDGLLELAMLNTLDMNLFSDDFMGDTLSGTYQSTASGANSVAAAVTSPTDVNGLCLLDPGDANSGRSDLSLGLHYYGQYDATIAFRFKTPNPITNTKFELGFTDTISGTDAGAVNAKATPTWTATDAVVVVYDTTDDANLTFAGVANNTGSTAYDFTTQLAAGTYYTVVIQLIGTTAKAWLLDANSSVLETQPPGTQYMTGAVTANVLLTPWAFVQNRSGARHSLNLDAMWVWQWRTTTHSA